MAKRWGFGWMGSKNGIARELVDLLPAGDVFVDLFAGGCAMTHCALVSGKWQRVIANDIKGTAVFFKQAIEGKVENLYEWVSRDEFNARKDRDIKVVSCWSFGNTGSAYLYNKEIEVPMHRLHEALTADTLRKRQEMLCAFIDSVQVVRKAWEDRVANKDVRESEGGGIPEYLRGQLRAALKDSGHTAADVDRYMGTQMAGHYFGRSQWEFPTEQEYGKLRGILTTLPEYKRWWPYLNALGHGGAALKTSELEAIVQLTRFARMEHLMRLFAIDELAEFAHYSPRLSVYECDYREVPIPEGAVVYADPPYAGVEDYGTDFDTPAFWQWADAQPFPVFVSEYTGAEGFTEVWSTDKRCILGSCKHAKQTTERLFVQDRFAGEFMPKSEAEHPELFADTEQLEQSA